MTLCMRRRRLATAIGLSRPEVGAAGSVWQALWPGGASQTLVRSVVTMGLALGGLGRAAAATYYVTSAADDYSAGTLRYEVSRANATGANPTIQFDAALSGQAVALSHGAISIYESMTIKGLGVANTTINAGTTSRILTISSGGSARTVPVSGMRLTNGSATGVGGAIYATSTNLNLQDVVLNNNVASSKGGAIYLADPGLTAPSISFGNVTITNNHANYGGGIYARDAQSLSISNSTISSNYAIGALGGVYARNIGSLSLDATTVSGNTARRGNAGGIGIFAANAAPTFQISNCTISGNLALIGGGVIYPRGGGIWIKGASGTISGATISNNTAHDGGGVYVSRITSPSTIESVLTVRRSTISNNTASFYGGGIDVRSAKTLDVAYSVFAGNDATDAGSGHGGGAIAMHLLSGKSYVRNSTLYGNYAYTNGGGIGFFNAVGTGANNTTIASATIVGNSTQFSGGNGIYAKAGTPVLNSTIVANNVNVANNAGSQDLLGSFKVNFSDVKKKGTATFVAGSGNNLADGTDPSLGPLAANGGPTQSLLPNAGSPVLDTADTAILSGVDQRGLPRVVSNHADVGAVERQNPEDVIFQDGFELQ